MGLRSVTAQGAFIRSLQALLEARYGQVWFDMETDGTPWLAVQSWSVGSQAFWNLVSGTAIFLIHLIYVICIIVLIVRDAIDKNLIKHWCVVVFSFTHRIKNAQ